MPALNKKLVKMIVDRIDIVGTPANGERRFPLIKSVDPDNEPVIRGADETLASALTVMLSKAEPPSDEELLVYLKKQPELANLNSIDPEPVPEDEGRTEVIHHVNALVKQSADLPLPLRKHLAGVCAYMGLEGPDTTTPDVPDMDPVMNRLDALSGVLEKIVVAMASPPAPAATPLKKEEDPVPVPVSIPAVLVKQISEDKLALQNMASQFDVIRKRVLAAVGKDPDGPTS